MKGEVGVDCGMREELVWNPAWGLGDKKLRW